MGLNVTLENSQLIAECHQLVAHGVRSAHDVAWGPAALPLVVSVFPRAVVALSAAGAEISVGSLRMPAFPLPVPLGSQGLRSFPYSV